MTGEELLAEGRKLARDCVVLRDHGDVFAATWRGEPAAPAPRGAFEHWISVDRSFLPATTGGTRGAGWISVFSDETDFEAGAVTFCASAPTAPSVKLYAHPSRSLPPLEAVLRLGPDSVQAWLKDNGWDCNPSFPDQGPLNFYERAYQDESPLYAGDAYALLGGWHMLWPDDDEFDPTKQLLVWTLAESEPWIEVSEEGGRLRVQQRIT